MCGACSGTAPGSSVRIPNSPSSFVGHRPKPRKPGTAPLGSSGWSNRPFGSACHVSINASGTGAPSPSVTTPRIHTAPSVPSSTTVGPSSHGRPSDRYGPTVCEGVEGSFGPAWLICPPVFFGPPSPPQRTQPAAADSTRPIPTGLASEKILAHSSSVPCGTPAPDRTRERKDPRSLVLFVLRVFERRRFPASHHDVETERQRPFRHRPAQIERRDQPLPRLLVRNRIEDRVLEEQRIVGEVHLRDEPLGERRTEHGEVDVRGTPGVVVVLPRIRPRLDGDELVPALVVGDRTAHTVEVRVDRTRPVVPHVPIPTTRVRLPDLDQRIRDRFAVTVEQAPVHQDALPLGFLRVLPREVVVQLADPAVAQQRTRHLGQFV